MIYTSKMSLVVKQYIERQGCDKPKLTRRLKKLQEGDVYLIDTLSCIDIDVARSMVQRGVRVICVVEDITLTEPVLDALLLLGYKQPKREKKTRQEEFRDLKEDLGVTGYYDQFGIWREGDCVPQEVSTELNDEERMVYWQENSICSRWIDKKILEAWPEARICNELKFLRKLLPYVFVNHRGSKISLQYVKRRIQQIRE
jgi:hypothetical protein